MKEKNIKGLDNYFYYENQLDTTFVLTSFETCEEVGNVIYYVFTPVYGSYEHKYFLPVAYFESFDKKMQEYGLYRINDIHDITYNFEQ
jgi:hypothetical protein